MTAPTRPNTWLAALLRAARTLLHGVDHLLLPNSCHLCAASLPPDAGSLCPLCRTALAADPRRSCPRCAADIGPFASVEGGCSRCRDTQLAFAAATRLGPYEGVLANAVLRMKGRAGDILSEILGELWAAERALALAAATADVVIPVPLHWRARWWRGHNQSESLARALAAALGRPCRPHWLRKVRATPPQHHLTSAAARRKNVHGAFRARPACLADMTVLLVDDVMTTGSTADEAARTLRRAGAARVVVAVLARA